MRICLVSKYPPIEGQVSTINYWLARGLAKKGHTVVIVTNAYESHATEKVFVQANAAALYEPEFAESGGRVIVLNAKAYDKDQVFIPRNNPAVTKLTNLILVAAKKFSIEIIFSHYLEPYAVAGHMASVFLNIPHVITHSGSDIGRLLKNPHLQHTYLNIIKAARYFIPKNKIAAQIPHNSINVPVSPFSPDTEFFNAGATMLDMNQFLNTAGDYIQKELMWHTNYFDESKVTFGFYGKLLKEKHIYEIVSALGKLNAQHHSFNLVIMSRWIDGEENLRTHIKDNNLRDCTWVLPFLPTWTVPAFINVCDAILYLEHGWPMPNHVTIVPKEVVACGSMLITTEEVYTNKWHNKYLEPGKNCIVVKNPGDVDEIIQKLTYFLGCINQQTKNNKKSHHNSLISVNDHNDFLNSWESVFFNALSP